MVECPTVGYVGTVRQDVPLEVEPGDESFSVLQGLGRGHVRHPLEFVQFNLEWKRVVGEWWVRVGWGGRGCWMDEDGKDNG